MGVPEGEEPKLRDGVGVSEVVDVTDGEGSITPLNTLELGGAWRLTKSPVPSWP